MRSPLARRLGFLVIVLGAAALCVGRAAVAGAAPKAAAPQSDRKRPRLELEEAPQPFRPRQPQTEEQKQRLEAVALFASGRMLERVGRSEEALRHYQRAFRQDSEAIEAARAVVPLAHDLKRYAVAVRYALKVVEQEDADPMLLRQLGVHLTREGDFAGAAKLYERAAAAAGDDAQTAADVLLRMEMGRLYHLIEDYAKAADSFARVLGALEKPKDYGIDDNLRTILLGEAGPTYNLMGECFLRAERYDEAAAAFRQAHQVDPNQGVLDFHLAQIEARRGRPKQALEKLQGCFEHKIDSEDTAPYELLAELLEELGRKEQLIARLEGLQSKDPGNVPFGYYLADRYLAGGRLEKAELLYLVLLKKDATTAGYQGLAEIYRRTGQPGRLLETLGEAVAITGALETFGPEADAIIGDAKLVDALLDEARRRADGRPEELTFGMQYAAALLALDTERFDAAGEMFELALKAQPDQAAELFSMWGVGLLLADRPGEAAVVFQRAIDEKAVAEDNPVFYYYLAGALALDDKTEPALAAAREAAEARPESAEYAARVAWVLYMADRYDDARRVYRELIEQFDDEHESAVVREILREARLILSNLCVIQNDLDGAEEWLEQVLDEFPDDPGAGNDLGYLWADRNKHLARAREMIERAVTAEPENPAYRDSLGWVYYRLGRYDEAVAELEKAAAAAGAEPDGVILDHLGDALEAAGRPDEARDAWRRAAEAFRADDEVEKAKAVEKKSRENK